MEDSKELSVVKDQTNKELKVVSDMVIATPDDYAKADEVLVKIKSVGKMIEAKKKEITDPLDASLKKIRELFKPIETTHETAEKIIKKKMVVYRIEDEKKKEAEKAKIAAKVETGYIKTETAVKKMDAVGNTKNELKEAGVTTSVRKLPRIRIIKESDIPREYMVVNEKLALEALKAGKQVPGAELWYETIIA